MRLTYSGPEVKVVSMLAGSKEGILRALQYQVIGTEREKTPGLYRINLLSLGAMYSTENF